MRKKIDWKIDERPNDRTNNISANIHALVPRQYNMSVTGICDEVDAKINGMKHWAQTHHNVATDKMQFLHFRSHHSLEKRNTRAFNNWTSKWRNGGCSGFNISPWFERRLTNRQQTKRFSKNKTREIKCAQRAHNTITAISMNNSCPSFTTFGRSQANSVCILPV